MGGGGGGRANVKVLDVQARAETFILRPKVPKKTLKKKRHKELQSLYRLHGGVKVEKVYDKPRFRKKEKRKNL